jgi:hypothetical protein
MASGTENLISEFWNATKPARIKSRETGVFEAFMKVFHLSIDDNDREYLCSVCAAKTLAPWMSLEKSISISGEFIAHGPLDHFGQ